jgi:hypothetical protein
LRSFEGKGQLTKIHEDFLSWPEFLGDGGAVVPKSR